MTEIKIDIVVFDLLIFRRLLYFTVANLIK